MKKTKRMKKSESTKYALVCSVLSLLLSISMLVGITYAWFTDSVSSGITTILAGSWLDIELVDADNQNIENTTLQWTDQTGQVVTSWIPGNTYNLQSFRIKNNGNLALKYEITITVPSGLNDVVWSYQVGDQTYNNFPYTGDLEAEKVSELIRIAGTFDASGGSDIQNSSFEGIRITVVATQAGSDT